MQSLPSICLCLMTGLVAVQSDETCSGMRTLRQAANCCCSDAEDLILRVPSDGTGVYHLVLNASLPIYSRENLKVVLENAEQVKAGTADHLLYVVSHPSCEGHALITRLVFNDHVLCTNDPHRADTKRAATQFTHSSTHYGVKNATPTNYWQNILAGNILGVQKQNQDFGKLPENNFLYIGAPGMSMGSGTYPNNLFLKQLQASQEKMTQNQNNLFSRFQENQFYPNNPFLSAFNGGTTGTGTTKTPPFAIKDVCGYSSRPLIRGGSDVQAGEFPWLGALFQMDGEGTATTSRYICTVNLITARHVLTAAHCVHDNAHRPEYHAIVFGPITHRSTRNYFRVSRIDLHPQYQKTNATHDLAMMTLAAPIEFSLSLNPICLWRRVFQTQNGPTEGMVAGFGPDYTNFKKIEYPIVSQDTCRGSHVHFHYTTSEYTFCAGTRNNTGPCLGDSGAGFMQWISDRFYLRGLVSHSLSSNGGCNLRHYVIFVDLAKEVDWIMRTLQ